MRGTMWCGSRKLSREKILDFFNLDDFNEHTDLLCSTYVDGLFGPRSCAFGLFKFFSAIDMVFRKQKKCFFCSGVGFVAQWHLDVEK